MGLLLNSTPYHIGIKWAQAANNSGGLSWDGTNLLYLSAVPAIAYRYSGFSTTVTDSFSTPLSAPYAMGWDGENTLINEDAVDVCYKLSGFSTTVTDTFALPSINPDGLEWDGANVISSDVSQNRIYKHSGFSSTITNSFSGPSIVTVDIADDSWSGAGGAEEYEKAVSDSISLAEAKTKGFVKLLI